MGKKCSYTGLSRRHMEKDLAGPSIKALKAFEDYVYVDVLCRKAQVWQSLVRRGYVHVVSMEEGQKDGSNSKFTFRIGRRGKKFFREQGWKWLT